MDKFGGLPLWWQWFIPRYKNWGGVGWSAGRWNNNPKATVWTVPALDAVDECFKQHDRGYQSGYWWIETDQRLIVQLQTRHTPSLYGRCYRVGAMALFELHIWKMKIFGNKRIERGDK